MRAILLIFLMLFVSYRTSAQVVYPGDKISIDTKPRVGEVYFVSWYDHSVVSYHSNKLNFDLKPVDTSVINITVDRLTFPGDYSFVKYEVIPGENPSDIKNWKDTVVLHYTVCPISDPTTTRFYPIPEGCN